MRRRGETGKQYEDRLYYPVQLRIELLPDRDRNFMERVYGWLNTHAPRRHALHPARFPGGDRVVEAITIHLEDPALAVRIVDDLGLPLAFGKKPSIR